MAYNYGHGGHQQQPMPTPYMGTAEEAMMFQRQHQAMGVLPPNAAGAHGYNPNNGMGGVGGYPMANIEYPGMNDIMCGRGGGTNNHIGNIRFRQLVNEHKGRYLAAPKSEKPKVAMDVVQIWRGLDPPGRFLTKSDLSQGDDSLWHDVGDKKAREKASQCLRERTPDIMPLVKKLKEEQEQKAKQAAAKAKAASSGTGSESDKNSDSAEAEAKAKIKAESSPKPKSSPVPTQTPPPLIPSNDDVAAINIDPAPVAVRRRNVVLPVSTENDDRNQGGYDLEPTPIGMMPPAPRPADGHDSNLEPTPIGLMPAPESREKHKQKKMEGVPVAASLADDSMFGDSGANVQLSMEEYHKEVSEFLESAPEGDGVSDDRSAMMETISTTSSWIRSFKSVDTTDSSVDASMLMAMATANSLRGINEEGEESGSSEIFANNVSMKDFSEMPASRSQRMTMAKSVTGSSNGMNNVSALSMMSELSDVSKTKSSRSMKMQASTNGTGLSTLSMMSDMSDISATLRDMDL